MGVGGALADAAQRLRGVPTLGVGLHLTLVGERPVCRPEEVPSLVGRDGLFLPSYRAFLFRYLRRGVRSEDVLREFHAQADLAAGLGVPLDHLDSHQHLHLLPGLLGQTIRLARELGIRWIRAPQPSGDFGFWILDFGLSTGPDPNPKSKIQNPKSERPLTERLMFAVASAWARRQVERAGLPLVAGSLGFDCSGHLSYGYLLSRIPTLPPGVTELICHPGEPDPDTQRRYGGWGYSWGQETGALTCPEVRGALEQAGVGLTSFGDLNRRQGTVSEVTTRKLKARR